MAEVKIAADSGGGSVGLAGPATTTSNAAEQFKLPVADGSANQHLKTDGSGNLGWASDAGKILQVVSGTTTSGTSTTSTSWVDTGLTATITPASSSNKILVFGAGQIGHYRDYSGQGMGIRMVRTVSSSDTEVYSGNGDEFMSFDNGQLVATRDRGSWATMISDSPSTTSACAYKVQVLVYTSNNGGTAYFNSHDAGTAYMHLLEVAA